jgi:hypothetical protein
MTVPALSGWKARLATLLPLYGHRNWIVIADSAYPAQSNPGIETLVSGDDQIPVVRHVLDAINACGHVRANVYADQELSFVSDADAPGVCDYRRELETALAGARAQYIPHEQIIGKLDQAAKLFNVLIIKTNLTIPYTSVFFELDCGYWSADSEQRLRDAIARTSH